MSKVKGLSLNKPDEIFLCQHCLNVMCEDCISIADEYQYQNDNFKRAAFRAEDALANAIKEMERLNRELADWKRLATLGYPEVILEWMQSQVAK